MENNSKVVTQKETDEALLGEVLENLSKKSENIDPKLSGYKTMLLVDNKPKASK